MRRLQAFNQDASWTFSRHVQMMGDHRAEPEYTEGIVRTIWLGKAESGLACPDFSLMQPNVLQIFDLTGTQFSC